MNSKQSVRKKMLFARKRITDVERGRAEFIIGEKIIDLCANHPEWQSLGVYLPLNSEINLRQTWQKLETTGVNIALPFLDKTQIMQFTKCINIRNTTISENGFLTYNSGKTSLLLDAVICPFIAADKYGYRLGYGGGYYDRYLSQSSDTVAIGIGFAFQLVDALEIEAHDQKLNYIITEKGITTF